MNTAHYPDFNKFENILAQAIMDSHPEFKKKVRCLDVSTEMFPQIWPDTAGGFSEPGMMSGQAMTREYTTVMTVTIWADKDMTEYKFYGVFFGNEPAYLVTDPTEMFLKDLENHSLKTKYEAGKVY